MIVISLHYKGIFRVSEPFDPEKISPQKIASSLVFWKSRGESTHPDSWEVAASYAVNRKHPEGKNRLYDRLLFMKHKGEATNSNPFELHGSAWLTKE